MTPLPRTGEKPGAFTLKILQTPPESEDKNTPLFSKPAYLTKTSSSLEIHITDCFWYPQISFDWEKLTPKEFHHLIEKIRTGILCIVRQICPAEENPDRGFSRLIQKQRKNHPKRQITIIIHPIQPHSAETKNPYTQLSESNNPYKHPSEPNNPYKHPSEPNNPHEHPSKKTSSAETQLIRQKKVKRWMEYKELRDRISLAYELKRTGGYIIRTSALLTCTRQQIHTAMKYHGFLRGEILIFRGA